MKQIKTLEDLRREFAPTFNPNEVIKSRLSKMDKVALFVTRSVGSMGFIYICLILVTIPFFYNPAMPLIQYISSGYLQLLLLPLILIGQNLQGRHSELRAQHDYETNIRAEKEIEAILLHLERDHELILQMLERLEKLEKKKS